MAEVRSGSFSTSGYSDPGYPDHYVFSWSLVSQSITDNTSTISWSLYATGGSSDARFVYVKEKYVTVNGATQSNATLQTTYNNTTPFSGTAIIKHGNDGKGSFSASAGGAFYYYGSYNSTGSGSWDLPAIARATTPTLSATSITANGTNSITMTINPADSSFKHKIRYEFGGLVSQISGVSISGQAITSDFTAQGNITATFTPPVALCNQIPNDNSGTCKLILYTYNSSGTHIGTKTVNITLSVPSYIPTITNIALTGNNLLSGAYVQGKSTVKAVVTATTSYGASIKSCSSVVDGKTYTGTNFTSSVLSNGSKTVSVTITDTRGKTVKKDSSAFTVYAYAIPTITSFTLERQADETTVVATVKGSVSAVNNKNAKTVNVTLDDKTLSITPSSYTIDDTLIFTNVSTDKTLTATAKIWDSYTANTPAKRETVLPTVAVTMDFWKEGNGVAFGKVAEQGNLLDVAWNIKNNSVPTLLGGLGQPIPAGANLNTLEFITPGNYVCALNDTAKTLVNSPTVYAFNMQVSNCLDTWTNVQTGSYMYLIRKITNLDGNIWVQYVRKEGGDWHYTGWRMIVDTGSCRDYVIEQGISDDWNYTKWNSGKAEAWRNIELGEVPLTTNFTTGVYSNNSYNARGVTLPSGLFTTIPLAFASVYSNGYTHCQVSSATASQVIYRLWSPYSTTASGVIVPLYVIGKWK